MRRKTAADRACKRAGRVEVARGEGGEKSGLIRGPVRAGEALSGDAPGHGAPRGPRIGAGLGTVAVFESSDRRVSLTPGSVLASADDDLVGAHQAEYVAGLLVEKVDLQKTFVLRRILNPMGTTDAIEFLISKLKQTKTNSEFFDSMNT